MANNIIASFVHGLVENNSDLNSDDIRPSIWTTKDSNIHYFPFPRNPKDFYKNEDLILGEMPLKDSQNFEKLPRFGFTGLKLFDGHIYAGSWNSVYKINYQNLKLEYIISNRLMNDLHGIYVDKDFIITVLTCIDAVVISNHNGEIVDCFTISRDLSTVPLSEEHEIDWRFISKQFRGSCGFWHFNYIQKINNEIWLTSRNANAFVVVNLTNKTASLRLMNLCTPVLIHDGLKFGDKYYFTSIDGKIITAADHQETILKSSKFEDPGNLYLYNRDLVTEVIEISKTDFGREPNWCRGIAVSEGKIYVTIDGRYDSDLSFGVLEIDEKTHKTRQIARLRWDEVGNEDEIRYVTGFDLIVG